MKVMLALWLLVAASAFAVETRPNILLIVAEDHGPELGCYGDPFARSPNLDRLAAEGVRFTRAFVPQAGCSQSRASFLTGRYPHQHGQIGLATWGFRLYRAETPNLPGSLKTAGYRTGIIGKLHINPESAFPFDFAEIPGANFNRKNLKDYAKHARTFIGAGDAPFFLSVNFPDTHEPWLRQVDGLPVQPQTGTDVRALPYFGIDPPEMREMIADYYNCVSRLDTLVGDLLTVLQQSGKAENTIVIFIGDHGADFLRGKRTSYEGGLRIPLIMRWSGHAQPQVREEMVSTIDLMPTLLAAAGAAPVEGLPGRSLEPLLRGEEVAWRSHLFAEYHTHAAASNFYPQRSVRTQRYKLIENLLPDEVNPGASFTINKLDNQAAGHGSRGKIDLRAAIAAAPPLVQSAYATMERPPHFELYDLADDPFEFRNLANSPEHADTLAELQQQLADWRRQTHDPLLREANLQRLKAEVTAVNNRTAGKAIAWGYPDYFFGREPLREAQSPPKKGKKLP